MNKFEVYYLDAAIKETTFMVVVPADSLPEAYALVESLGYLPIRVNQLIWGK